MSPHIPKKLEKFNNYVSNAFKVKDEAVSVKMLQRQCCLNLMLFWVFFLDKEALVGIC